MGVIFEYWYYGESFFIVNFMIENYCFYIFDQVMVDMVYFVEYVKFFWYEYEKFNVKDMFWIWYGGFYVGVFVVMFWKKYLESIWGVVLSFSVLEFVVDFWLYYEFICKYVEENCIEI